MSKRDWKLLFEDILESIQKIERYTQDVDYHKFVVNSMIVDAVVRNLEVIGEASKNVPKEIQWKHSGIPWKKLAGIRNRIVHEYFGVDHEIIWFIVKNELARLKQLIENGLEE
jgi:uncharacterized protein with HEPN domain